VTTRRMFLLGLVATLAACAPEPQPVTVITEPDPDPESVYTPGPIPWENLTEEHKRRARQALTRLGEDVPDDATLQARWMIMSPAQQRFMIRRPPPPPPPPRRTARGRGAPPPPPRRAAPATTTRARRR
jgi:hypothetical protein